MCVLVGVMLIGMRCRLCQGFAWVSGEVSYDA